MKTANIKIITNNPLVSEKYTDVAVSYDCSVEGIFKLTRDEIHLGAVLINHPLSGSVKPNESPYKSLVVSTKRGSLDADSLKWIESALETLYKLHKLDRALSDSILADFQIIDLDLLDSAIFALPAEYYL
jgi:hypothetical protein